LHTILRNITFIILNSYILYPFYTKEYIKRTKKHKYKNLEMCNINVNFLSYIKTGKSFPSYETLEKLTKALNVSSKELFNFDEISSNKDLLKEINAKIQIVKDDNEKLKQIYAYLDSVI